jgi:hypothetical protein
MGRSDGSSGAMSTVTIERPASASRVISPCPISPPAPVTSVTGVRIREFYRLTAHGRLHS